MSDIAVQANNIGKMYHIGNVITKSATLRDKIADGFVAPFRRAHKLLKGEATGAAELDQTIWALKDISFDIKHGEIVGIIGVNGAGKSTLLKILSRITEPTEGFAEIRGRVSSLLEVGTGFHKELTGRENVYLNGAILGMRKSEIDRKFDEIVAFSEVQKFIDTPIKHYSSGMTVRLAFAVAAHLEPEILIIDEVLAVGDIRFQKKCINKMQDVGKAGRTVIFVSHNMSAITRLCERAILLDSGMIVDDGPANNVVTHYLNSGEGTSALREWPDVNRAPGDHVTKLRSVRVRDINNEISDTIDIRHPVKMEMEYDVFEDGHILLPHFRLHDHEGIQLFTAIDVDPKWRERIRPPGRYVSSAWIPGNLLNDGLTFVGAAMLTLQTRTPHFVEPEVVAFHVADTDDTNSARGDWVGGMGGVMRPMLEWDTEYIPFVPEAASSPTSVTRPA
ncbi:MAG: ATP-binding cassette domain-containing protein [Anaerolineae bacterium]|nr:ATP-binding cassette domain-containing protein [Anaerolineae bacterium]